MKWRMSIFWLRTGPREMTAQSKICFSSSFLCGLQLPGKGADIWGLSCITGTMCDESPRRARVCNRRARRTLTFQLPDEVLPDQRCLPPPLFTELFNLSQGMLLGYRKAVKIPFFFFF